MEEAREDGVFHAVVGAVRVGLRDRLEELHSGLRGWTVGQELRDFVGLVDVSGWFIERYKVHTRFIMVCPTGWLYLSRNALVTPTMQSPSQAETVTGTATRDKRRTANPRIIYPVGRN